MKKSRKKLTLNRDTLHQLSAPLQQVAGGLPTNVGCTIQATNGGCTIFGCITASCPTRCGQWYC